VLNSKFNKLRREARREASTLHFVVIAMLENKAIVPEPVREYGDITYIRNARLRNATREPPLLR
jgi:hypothetical protein